MDYAAIATVKAAMNDEDVSDLPLPDVRRLVRKSALLNLGIIVSVLMMAASVGRPGARAVAILTLMMSLVIWVATFLTWLLVLIVANFQRLGRLLTARPRRETPLANPLADDWLDGPGL